MPKEFLEIQITADNSKAVAELNELGTRLKTFETQIKKATDAEVLIRLQKSISDTKTRMEALNSSINPLVQNTQNFAKGSNQAAQALTNVGRVAQDLPFGFMGIQNNLNPLLESFQRLKTETGSTGGALKALGSSLIGAGGVGLALSVASSAFLLFGDRLFATSKKAEEAKKAIDDVTSSITKDAAQVEVLVKKYQDSNLSLGQRKSILDQLNRISPEYFAGLKAETTSFQDLTKAANEYTASLTNQIKAKVLGIQLEKVLTDKLKAEAEQQKTIALQQDFNIRNRTGRTDAGGSPALAKQIKDFEKVEKLLVGQIALLTKVKELQGGGSGGSPTTPVYGLRQVKVEERPLQELAVNEALRERLRLIQSESEALARQQAARQQREFLIAGGVPAQKTQALAEYDQNQLARQQEILGLEQSRKSALDEINTRFQKQQVLVQSVGSAFQNLFTDVAKAENPFEALTNAVKQLVVDLAAAAAKMLLIRALMNAINPAVGAAKGIGGILGGIIGGGFAKGGVSYGPQGGHMELLHGTEAVLTPAQMSGLVRNSMNAGAIQSMGSNGGQDMNISGEFVARGQDLVLALQRSNYSLNLRRG